MVTSLVHIAYKWAKTMYYEKCLQRERGQTGQTLEQAPHSSGHGLKLLECRENLNNPLRHRV